MLLPCPSPHGRHWFVLYICESVSFLECSLICFLDSMNKWWNIVFIFLCLPYFTSHNALQSHSYCCKWQNRILLHIWVIFHCVCMCVCVCVSHIFFIHLSVDGHLSWLKSWLIAYRSSFVSNSLLLPWCFSYSVCSFHFCHFNCSVSVPPLGWSCFRLRIFNHVVCFLSQDGEVFSHHGFKYVVIHVLSSPSGAPALRTLVPLMLPPEIS